MAPQNRKLVLPITLIGKAYRPKSLQQLSTLTIRQDFTNYSAFRTLMSLEYNLALSGGDFRHGGVLSTTI